MTLCECSTPWKMHRWGGFRWADLSIMCRRPFGVFPHWIGR